MSNGDGEKGIKRLTTFSQLSRRARFEMLAAFHVALVDIGVKSVAERLESTEPIDFSMSGNFTRGKEVEKVRQKKISMEVDMNFMFERYAFTDKEDTQG